MIRTAAWILAILLLLVVAIRFAQPIEDGDIFWQIAYGSQMVEQHTLRVDHSSYTWMPASNDTVYCAWAAELLFLGIWKSLGIAGLYALRYAVMLAVLGLLAWHARRCGVAARPETYLAMLVTVLASVAATAPKPELLSVGLWSLLVFCWFSLLDAHRHGRPLLPWIYAPPCIMLLWVNTHGGFLMAAPFLAITAAANLFLLPKREARHTLAAGALCVAATAITPYGARYPLQLLWLVLGRSARPDIAWNNEFQSIFGTAGWYYHLPEFLLFMTVVLMAAFFFGGKARFAIAALFVAYVPLDAGYVRFTFLLPPIFAFGVLELWRGAGTAGWRKFAPAAATGLFLWFGGRALWMESRHPQTDAWLGFGIAYSQPVEEAEFLAQGRFGTRIYNTYNAGGYLLWRLHPRYQVMVDARSFPFLGWFDELQTFSLTTDQAEFRRFLARHPADVAVADFQQDPVWRSFLNTPGWRPVFYGPAAAVFAPAGTAGPIRPADSLRHMRNAEAAVKVFDFAIAVSDYRTAWDLLDQIEGPLAEQAEAAQVDRMREYRAAHRELEARDYRRAWDLFSASFRSHPIDGRDNTILTVLKARLQIPANDPRAPGLETGLARLVQQ